MGREATKTETAAGSRRPALAPLVKLLLVPLAGLCLFLLLYAATFRGRLLAAGVALMVFALAGPGLYGLPRRWARRRRLAWHGLVLAGAAIFMFLALTGPAGTGGDATLIAEHVFARSPAGYRPVCLANLVPEVDQVCWGIGLARWFDPVLTGEQASDLRRLTRELERETEGEAALRDLGSALDWPWEWLGAGLGDRGHYLAILPRERPLPPPLIVFLHGAGGPFAAYRQALLPLAREHGLALIMPTWGFGDWQSPGGTAAIDRAIEHACRRYGLDRELVFLVALSNGGRGATRAVAAGPGRFAGAVFISAALEREPIERGEESGGWAGLPVLLLHGLQDRRLPYSLAETGAELMRRGGAEARLVPFTGQDHFLFFRQRQRVLDQIVRWLTEE